MKPLSLYCTTALIASLAPAFADVTPSDVWDAWKTQIMVAAPTVNLGTEETVGDTLTVKGISFASDGEDGKGSATLGDIAFRDLGDGTVQIVIAPEFPIDFAMVDAGGEDVAGKLVMRSTGLNMVASGDPGAVNYDFKADEMTMTVENITSAGTDIPMNVSFALKNAVGVTKTDTTDGYKFDATATADSMDLNVDVANPEVPGETFKMTGTSKDIKIVEKGTFPLNTNLENMAAAIAAGFDISGNISSGAANYQVDVQGPEAFTGAVTAASSNFDFALGPDGLNYGGGAKTITVDGTSAAMPLPIHAALDEYVFGLKMPTLKSDTAGDIALVLKLIGVTVNEEIWAMGDPGQILPRDPATVIIDVAGKGNFTADVFDPIAMAEVTGSPVNMESLNVNEVRVAVAGADVSGTGALTFDNSGAEMGMPPMPIGSIDVVAKGINGLLDNFVKMGLIPQEQLMGMKMMMGMYAKPGAGPDELTTTVEMQEGGVLLVNGMPLQ